MRRCVTRAALVLFTPALAGCLTSETLVKVNADGSGTIEQVLLMNTKALEALPAMMGDALGADVKATPSSGAAIDPAELFDEARARAAAERLGRGVRYVSSAPMTRGDLQGARMVYAFADVNTLRIEPDPPSDALGSGGVASTSEPLELRLTRQPNGNALLTIDLDENTAPKSKATTPKAAKGDMPPGMQEMLTQLLDGFRIAIDVDVAGALVHTSSPFVNGSRVTVLEMDLGMLMKDPANLERLADITPGASVAEMIPLLKDVKGIKVNQSPLTIEFTGR